MTFTFNYNDVQSLEDSLDEDVACVIMEPIVFEEPKNGFLQRVKELCEQNGSLLIFDEMWTGFRLALGGAQEYFNVNADLATFSKAVANGMPLSLLTGRKEIMQLLDKEVFFYTTFGGEALSLAAAKATIDEMREKNVAEYLDTQGSKLKDGYNQIVQELNVDYTKCIGYNCRSLITFDAKVGNPLLMKSLVQQELIRHGILWSGFHNMSFSHTDDDIAHTLNAYKQVLPILDRAIEEDDLQGFLKGDPVEPVFRKTGNFNTKPKMKLETAEL
jgi:glutamate-1-semialdehyde aminotransferase